MIAEDLLFWLAGLHEVADDDPNVLCIRHADAMVVPRGWTLDDLRDDELRLFRPQPVAVPAPEADDTPTRARRPRPPAPDPDDTPVQLQIDGTGEIGRPLLPEDEHDDDGHGAADDRVDDDGGEELRDPTSESLPAVPWSPAFDTDDDLDGLLSVESPLLSRAFRGGERRRA